MNFLYLYFFLSIGSVSMFSFLTVAVWADARRKEREAFYKNEALKKIAEQQQGGATSAIDFLREEKRLENHRLREGQKLAGLICTAVGIGTMVLLYALIRYEPVFLAGLIPLLIGLALLIYAYVLGAKV